MVFSASTKPSLRLCECAPVLSLAYRCDFAPSYKFDIDQATGVLTNRRIFAFADSGIPDGIQIDSQGNIYSGCGDGVQVRTFLTIDSPSIPNLSSGLGLDRDVTRKVLLEHHLCEHGFRRKGSLGYHGRD